MSTPKYQGPFVTDNANSTRWDAIQPRAGDIIVATPAKCGTTWTQMLCLLLVHGAPLPQPLGALSPWIDLVTPRSLPAEEFARPINAQPFRRVLKTHTPLHGLRYRDDALYVTCGRDPRDAFLSLLDHRDNQTSVDSSGDPLPNEAFASALNFDDASEARLRHIEMMLTSMSEFWNARALPNILFLHYDDLSDDLDAEMARLSKFLGIECDAEKRGALLGAATFDAMRENADNIIAGARTGAWHSNADFFRKGRRGEWRDVLTPENQALYSQATRERFDHKMLDWLEQGRAATGDPRAL